MKKILSLLMSLVLLVGSVGFVFAVDTTAQAFADMPDDWSTQALQQAVANGLLSGYEEGGKTLIKADNTLTRAELAAIVNRAFAATKKSSITGATDVPASAWYVDEMAKAVKMGTFMLDTKMRPEEGITRQEAFAVLARAFKLDSGGDAKALDRFSDKADIAGWALASLAGMAEAGYIQGSGGKLQPLASITRAEFATVMANLVKQYVDYAGEVSAVAEGNVIVRAPGVTLKGLTVKGDLIIADGVGEGDVTLDGVKVQGRTVVRGGGVNSIIIRGGSEVGRVIVAKVDGVVRIFTEDGAEVEVIYVDDGSDDVIVEGTIGSLEVAGDDVTVTVQDATIGSAEISGNNSTIVVGDGSTLRNAGISGNNSGIVAEEGATIDKVTVTGAGATIDGEGSVREVDVQAGGDGAGVNTPGTTVHVAAGVEGAAAAGGTPVAGGQTATNNEAGTGAAVRDTPSGRHTTPQVGAIEITARTGVNGDGTDVTGKPVPNNEGVWVTLITATAGADIFYSIDGGEPTTEYPEGGFDVHNTDIPGIEFADDEKYGGRVIIKAKATRDGYTARTAEFEIVFEAAEGAKDDAYAAAKVGIATAAAYSCIAGVPVTAKQAEILNCYIFLLTIAAEDNGGDPVDDASVDAVIAALLAATPAKGVKAHTNRHIEVVKKPSTLTASGDTVTLTIDSFDDLVDTFPGSTDGQPGGDIVWIGVHTPAPEGATHVSVIIDELDFTRPDFTFVEEELVFAFQIPITPAEQDEEPKFAAGYFTFLWVPKLADIQEFIQDIEVWAEFFAYDRTTTVFWEDDEGGILSVETAKFVVEFSASFQDMFDVIIATQAIEAADYEDLEVSDTDDQVKKTAAVQAVVDNVKGDTTAVVSWNTDTSEYDVEISKGEAVDVVSIDSATFIKVIKAEEAGLPYDNSNLSVAYQEFIALSHSIGVEGVEFDNDVVVDGYGDLTASYNAGNGKLTVSGNVDGEFLSGLYTHYNGNQDFRWVPAGASYASAFTTHWKAPENAVKYSINKNKVAEAKELGQNNPNSAEKWWTWTDGEQNYYRYSIYFAKESEDKWVLTTKNDWPVRIYFYDGSDELLEIHEFTLNFAGINITNPTIIPDIPK
jgi:hypothetical protein